MYRITKSIPHWYDFQIYMVKHMTKEEIQDQEQHRKETGLLDEQLVQTNWPRNLNVGYGDNIIARVIASGNQ